MQSSRLAIGRIATLACCLTLACLGLGAASTDSSTASLNSEESFAERRARLEAMSEPDRDRLMRNQQRFQQLPEREQEQLRQLHASLEQDSQSDELKDVMHRYQAWLKTLPASQRAELPQLTIDERIERIKSLQAEERREKNRRLNPEDRKVFLDWIEKQVVAVLSESESREYKAIADERERRDFIRAHLDEFRTRRRSRPIAPEQLADLKQRLSAEAQQAMTDAQAEGREKFGRLLYNWVEQSSRDELRLPEIDKADLAKFFDTLSERERDDLLARPPDEMWQRLQWRYRQEKVRRNIDRRGNDRPDGDRPGRRMRQPDRPVPDAKNSKAGSV